MVVQEKIYLVAVPIIIIAVMVKVVSDKFKLKFLAIASRVVIALGMVFFIHFFAVSKGFNIIDMIVKFFTI